ncbi:DNA repair protein RecN [Schinkia azotoformans]|uniref:DNA repair protein RecN n=1 Tax=Schinkia azotoformans TaxID=1454 RepID=UPI002DB9DE5E|nr:DNA repair protein RecN [Schinkia azotoformans]MEC1718378.1 DNA repair protein RecN [Schinkia azotoformans]MEC1742537.1 DNA repair protein RecN [Schinkia azotoformans]MEC1745137.1 DNA repair protein RecN [Schinkia azotoformans]MEC1759686.1 DNA repair protein RecN [Schinkia azotoformans]MEC1766720.1 DNA repair protein RecN [Schinkia azotoformans]
MLAEMSIKNFAIIESLGVSFQKGLTVLTGETGAGKSIIIDAISLVAGGRGSSEFVRFGCNKAEIEGLFLLDNDNHPCIEKGKELGIDISDGMVVLHRDILTNGKSICRINGKLVTLGILREIGRTLIDIHGQHEHQDLMNSERHLPMIDQFDEKRTVPAIEEYQQLYNQFLKLKKQLKGLTENEQKMAHRLDLIQFQLSEIKNAELEPGEEEALINEKSQLSNFERIHTSVTRSYKALSGEQQGLDWVGLAMSELEDVSSLNDKLKAIFENISSSFYLLEEATSSLRDQIDLLEFDPERLDFIETRLNEIRFLKKKYGQTVEDILEYAAKIEDEIDQIQNREVHLDRLRKNIKEIQNDLQLEAENLSEIRKQIAEKLKHEIHKELKDLYMAKTVFDIQFALPDPPEFLSTGIDKVEFLISTNPGEPLKPLTKIASGGELSRIMLALKSIFSKHQGITSIIFDEVDTGVSGRVAQSMAEKIYKISNGSQVLCITHLPQVAAMADAHLYISKETKGDRTVTSISELQSEEKVKEVARMISGVEITDLTKQHASELLQLANQMKVGGLY